jgi:hypothetical protein
MQFRAFVGSVICLCLIESSAVAQVWPSQAVQRVDQKSLARSIQCETGLFARAVRNLRVPRDRMTGRAKITDKIESGWGFGGDASALILAKASAGVNYGSTYSNTLTFKKFNLHERNIAACRDRNTVALHDLRRCLARNAQFFGPGGPLGPGDSDCISQINVKLEASAGLSLPLNIVTIGPRASWSTSYVYGVQVVAPASE